MKATIGSQRVLECLDWWPAKYQEWGNHGLPTTTETWLLSIAIHQKASDVQCPRQKKEANRVHTLKVGQRLGGAGLDCQRHCCPNEVEVNLH